MFPNVRLLIGTLFIALLVLSCEFGVFAALRVNREPLSRLTSESAPLQLVAGNNAPRPVPISWSAPLNAPAITRTAQTGSTAADLATAQSVEHKVEALAPENTDGAVDTLNNGNPASPAVLQTALAPSPAAVLSAAPVPEGAAPIAQAPIPPANSPAPVNEVAEAHPDASGVPAEKVPASALGTAAGNNPPQQTAAGPAAIAALPEQQVPAAGVVKPAEAEPPQAALAAQPHETAAQAGEPPAGGAPGIAAVAPAAAEPPVAEPAEITGTVSNAAIPGTAAPKVEAPPAKPSPKIVGKPAVKKPHQAAHAPAQARHPVKKRIARRGPAPAVASSARTGSTFDSPVFQSAPQFQRQTKSRAAAKNTATNNTFSNTFGSNTSGAQFSPQ